MGGRLLSWMKTTFNDTHLSVGTLSKQVVFGVWLACVGMSRGRKGLQRRGRLDCTALRPCFRFVRATLSPTCTHTKSILHLITRCPLTPMGHVVRPFALQVKMEAALHFSRPASYLCLQNCRPWLRR